MKHRFKFTCIAGLCLFAWANSPCLANQPAIFCSPNGVYWNGWISNNGYHFGGQFYPVVPPFINIVGVPTGAHLRDPNTGMFQFFTNQQINAWLQQQQFQQRQFQQQQQMIARQTFMRSPVPVPQVFPTRPLTQTEQQAATGVLKMIGGIVIHEIGNSGNQSNQPNIFNSAGSALFQDGAADIIRGMINSGNR